jgi:hypothetical protein
VLAAKIHRNGNNHFAPAWWGDSSTLVSVPEESVCGETASMSGIMSMSDASDVTGCFSDCVDTEEKEKKKKSRWEPEDDPDLEDPEELVFGHDANNLLCHPLMGKEERVCRCSNILNNKLQNMLFIGKH